MIRNLSLFKNLFHNDLNTLCFNLFVEYEDLPGSNRAAKARELVKYMDRHGRLAHLRAALAEERPTTYQEKFRETPTAPPVPVKPRRNPRQVFVSHAHQDAVFAQKLAADLRTRGYPVWIAPDSIQIGEEWPDAINRGLEESGVVVVALTPQALLSEWVRKETNAAIILEAKKRIRFAPLDVAECDPPVLWSTYQYVPFRASYEAGLDALLGWLDGQVLISSKGTTLPAQMRPEASTSESTEQLLARLEALMAGDTRHVTQDQASEINQAVKALALKIGEQTGRNEYGAVYGQLYRKFGITSYKQLPAERFSEAMEWLKHSEETQFIDSETSDSNRRIHQKTGIDLIRIPAGPFLYGSADSDKMARNDEKPQRTINLPEYWIGRTPVTNAQYNLFVAATNRAAPDDWPGNSPPPDKLDHPVVNVSWYDAQAFCDWAGLQLPSELEWEKAARGTDGRIWPWGNDPPTDEYCNFNWSVSDTTPVGFYWLHTSTYGCTDMAGNVWEWTASWHTEGKSRVQRGGAWDSDQKLVRAAFRDIGFPEYGESTFGFRVAEHLSDPDS